MKNKSGFLFIFLIVALSMIQTGMARRGQYDEEARQAERVAKEQQKSEKTERHPIRNMAEGVKQATYDNAADAIGETAESTRTEAPVLGTLEGARQSTGKILDNTVKGVAKVATLGYGDVEHYEVVEPEKNSDDTTKVKIKF